MKFDRKVWLLCTLAVVIGFWLGSRSRPRPPKLRKEAEVRIPAAQQSSETIASTRKKSIIYAPPKPSEVQNVVTRIFGESISISRQSPSFAVGDFNGDDAEDLAVKVVPNPGSVSELNNEVANWTVMDVHHAELPPQDKRVYKLPPKPAPAKVSSADVLIAVIHGHGENGWRAPEARQAYLLTHAVGRYDSLKTLSNVSPHVKAVLGMPITTRDAIRTSDSEVPGLLYWTGAQYAWHSPVNPLVAKK